MYSIENQLIASCKKGNISKVKELVKQGVDIHVRDDAPLKWAAMNGQLEIVNYYDEYPLRVAIVNGHLEVVKYLVEQGADIHVLDDAPLIRAVTNGHLEIANYLRSVVGPKWKCFDCIVRATCLTLCEGWNKNEYLREPDTHLFL